MTRVRYQIRFSKTGLLRWISHRDLARLWERMLRRCGLVLSMTEGFHPKPRISFPDALALGIEGIDEVVELELGEELPAERVLATLAADDQPGLQIHRVCQVPPQHGKPQIADSTYEIPVPGDLLSGTAERIDELLTRESITVERKGQETAVPARDAISSLQISPDGKLIMVLAASRQASIRPSDILQALCLNEAIERGGHLVRSRVRLHNEIDPSHCISAPTQPDRCARATASTEAVDAPADSRLQTPSTSASHKERQLHHEKRNAD